MRDFIVLQRLAVCLGLDFFLSFLLSSFFLSFSLHGGGQIRQAIGAVFIYRQTFQFRVNIYGDNSNLPAEAANVFQRVQ